MNPDTAEPRPGGRPGTHAQQIPARWLNARTQGPVTPRAARPRQAQVPCRDGDRAAAFWAQQGRVGAANGCWSAFRSGGWWAGRTGGQSAGRTGPAMAGCSAGRTGGRTGPAMAGCSAGRTGGRTEPSLGGRSRRSRRSRWQPRPLRSTGCGRLLPSVWRCHVPSGARMRCTVRTRRGPSRPAPPGLPKAPDARCGARVVPRSCHERTSAPRPAGHRRTRRRRHRRG